MKRHILFILTLLISLAAFAQVSRLGKDIEYHGMLQATAGSGDNAPFWFTSNRYGLGSTENNSALLRVGIQRGTAADSLHKWRFGYGADIVGTIHHDSHFVLQQLYADIQWKALRLSVGQKERPLELRNQELSSGAMTTGINARPLPQVCFELPDFWVIPRTGKWLALKAHIAYGAYTDNGWQRDFNAGTSNLYSSGSLYHSKAGFLRIGNLEKFPVTLTAGLEMSCQFGGKAYNVMGRSDSSDEVESTQDMGHGFKQFWEAFVPGGSDANDGDYKNVAGNQLGSWHLRADYHGKGWGASFYAEHFFEDHSQLFMQYSWKDMLYGIEVNLPKNHFVNTVLYEHIGTMDQSGPVYHDATENLPIQISGQDGYYSHHLYGGWQHAGYTLGNPLLISPVYNTNHSLATSHSRIKAHHFGISGQPLDELGYRFLFTHEKSLGTYSTPLLDPVYGNFLLVEATYHPRWLKGLGISAVYGQNGGKLLGRCKGGMLTVSYSGLINKKK